MAHDLFEIPDLDIEIPDPGVEKDRICHIKDNQAPYMKVPTSWGYNHNMAADWKRSSNVFMLRNFQTQRDTMAVD